MKAVGLIAMLAALIIAAVLTLKNLTGKPSPDFQKATGIGSAVNVTRLPDQVKSKLGGAAKKMEERTRELEEIK